MDCGIELRDRPATCNLIPPGVVVVEYRSLADGLDMTVKDVTPLIGMPVQMDAGGEIQFLSRHYSDAISAAGGTPIIVPLTENPERMIPVAERWDGILLTGNNSDLDPSLYGAQRSRLCGGAQPLRDRMDFTLLETAFRRRIPVLAICFGVQSLNVFMGGSLIQDIPESIGLDIRHNDPESRQGASHKIEICRGSALEQIAGGTDAVVNSTHHQAIERVGEGLEVVARAPDGVVESVAYSHGTHWVLGVQWHPEKSFGTDGFSRKLFEFFLARCRAARGSDEGSCS
jgi:putative glutamine amidotransferase